jgi:hypothetical protein
MIPEFAPLVHPGCGRLHTVGELVSATSVVLKSDPPLESMRPTPQAVWVTLVVNIRAGTQKFGALKPPGNGTTVLWTHAGGLAALTSWTIVPPVGNGNGAKL